MPIEPAKTATFLRRLLVPLSLLLILGYIIVSDNVNGRGSFGMYPMLPQSQNQVKEMKGVKNMNAPMNVPNEGIIGTIVQEEMIELPLHIATDITPLQTPRSAAGSSHDKQNLGAVAGDNIHTQRMRIDPSLLVKSELNLCRGAVNSRTKERIVASASSSQLPQCPADFIRTANDSTDTVVDRNADWVEAKYNLYASRCEKRDGLMWSQLSMTAFEKIAIKVLKLLLLQSADSDATVFPSPSDAAYKSSSFYLMNEQRAVAQAIIERGNSLRILDWGAGCGVGVRFFSNFILNALGNATTQNLLNFNLMGIDLTGGAIVFANERILPTLLRDFSRRHKVEGNNMKEGALFLATSSNVSFCHADGTDLFWIPSETFDFVTAFGALLHVPSRLMCRTLSDMLRVTKIGGAVWGGYIDDQDTIQRLSQCTFECGTEYEIAFTLINERAWLKRTGMPKALLKRKPHSMLWRKIAKRM